jgi:hypothetical protein
MPMDDDIAVSDAWTADPPAPAPRSNRGFWVVTTALVLGCMFMLVEIFANFGTKDTIAHAEHTLHAAQAAAERVHQADGTYAGADHTRLSVVEPTLSWLPGTDASGGLDQVSVASDGSAWAAAVQARPGACFYLHLTPSGDTFYGVGTDCTGREALLATDPRW